MFVLDSSVALAMLLPDERSAAADALGEKLAVSGACVPCIWPLEVRNALLSAVRQKRLTARELDERLAVLAALPIEVEGSPDADRLAVTVALARRYDLTSYDAAYLELARHRAIPLATFDGTLRKACVGAKVALMVEGNT